MALTSVAEYKLFAGVSGTSEDHALEQVRAGVEAALKKLADRDFELTTYTGYYDGDGTRVLLLAEYPVVSITSVYEDPRGAYGQAPDAFPSTTLLTAGTDYALVKDGKSGTAETGRLLRLNGVWPCSWARDRNMLVPRKVPCPGSVKVVFQAGYSAIPADLKMVVWQTASRVRQGASYGRLLAAESLSDWSVQFADEAEIHLIGTSSQLISRYKRLRQRHKALG